MKYIVCMDVEVNPHDQDVMQLFPGIMVDRFQGTPIKITNINVVKDENE